MTPRNPWRRRVRDTLIPILWLWAAMGILGYALAAGAKADPATDFVATHAADICLALDNTPTLAGLRAVMGGVEATGLTATETGTAIAESVIYICPHHTPLLEQFVARYGQKGKTL